MKRFYLPAIILLAVSCSNEIAENTDRGENILRIGEIDTRSGETSEWEWKTGDELTVTANSKTAVYTRTADGKWSCGNTSFTKEAIGVVATDRVLLTFGKFEYVIDQTTESAYRLADYMSGTGSLNVVTISGSLAHKHADMVINITEGSGWNGQFASAMADAAGLSIPIVYAGGKYRLKAYHQGSTFRTIIPSNSVPTGTNITLGTLTLGSGNGTPQSLRGKTATITYTNSKNYDEASGKRFTLTVKLDASFNLTITSITVSDFNGVDVPGELKP
ncbi:hypothetical protein [uncultured Parabacteroides sp.]|uniref:hypothetical protein n=1 Tax=uncultured Parabacteroides sp. TaxID=512312 RepID=UPI0025EED9EC|nr:hypothetical protein [uncultured Parabacteroides sp.]